MDFRILGPLEVLEDGRALDLGGARQRAVVALLVLHANRVVAQEHLIDALWDGEPPETARKALQVYVSQLRKVLGRERLETKAADTCCASGRTSSISPAPSASTTAASRMRRCRSGVETRSPTSTTSTLPRPRSPGCGSSASRVSSSESSVTSSRDDTRSWSASSRPSQKSTRSASISAPS